MRQINISKLDSRHIFYLEDSEKSTPYKIEIAAGLNKRTKVRCIHTKTVKYLKGGTLVWAIYL